MSTVFQAEWTHLQSEIHIRRTRRPHFDLPPTPTHQRPRVHFKPRCNFERTEKTNPTLSTGSTRVSSPLRVATNSHRRAGVAIMRAPSSGSTISTPPSYQRTSSTRSSRHPSTVLCTSKRYRPTRVVAFKCVVRTRTCSTQTCSTSKTTSVAHERLHA